MEINTIRFGTIDVQKDKVLSFPKGILGYSNDKQYILFPHAEGSPFFWLQSVDDGSLAFVVMNPRLVKNDYSIKIEETAMETLQANDTTELDVMCIVTIPPNRPKDMTINLLGPIIINTHKRRALQIVCPDENYSHRYPILEKES